MFRLAPPVYDRRPSALHAARAGASSALCAALALAVALYVHPLVLVAGIAAIVVAGLLAGVGRQLGRAARLAVPLALLVAIVNPLVTSRGETVLVRGFAVIGHRFDTTLEAVAYGALAGLRVGAFAMAFGLFSACVDPDELLHALRRVAPRSALAASLATRLVPVLTRDALRMGDAARCRPEPAPRAAVLRAAVAGSLDRAVDVAAALEVRGYSAGGRPPRRRRPRSRHDVRVFAAAVSIAAVAVAGKLAGLAEVVPYERFEMTTGIAELALAAALIACAAIPFAGPGARMGVSRG